MNRWQIWRQSLRRSAKWEDTPQNDREIRHLQELFEAAPKEDHLTGGWTWKGFQQLLSEDLASVRFPTFWTSVASLGPRFAIAAGVVIVIAASAFWYASDSPLVEQSTLIADLAPLDRSETALIDVLEARNPGGLLQFIAYDR